jgi:hypothetical protein
MTFYIPSLPLSNSIQPDDTTLSTTLPTPQSSNKKSRSAPNTMRRGTPRHRRVRIQAKMPVTPPRLSRHPSPQRHAKFGSDSNLQIDQADELEDRVCIDRLFLVVY